MRHPAFAAVDVAGPGFLNITLDSAAQGELARTVVSAGSDYGARRRPWPGSSINLEFVSANPTGPAPPRARPMGGRRRRARPGPQRDRRRGHPRVLLQRRGRADRPLRRSRCWPPRTGEPTPEDGYGGDYIGEIVGRSRGGDPDLLDLPERASAGHLPRARADLMFAGDQRSRSTDFGVHFDVYFNEQDLHDEGELDAALAPAAASRATSTRRTAPSGCARPTSATTRTGCSSTQRRRLDLLRRRRGLLPRQAGARVRQRRRSCSAPTTTATSAGSRRSPPASATTPTRTSRS